jgi:dipeptidyl aminopeptidase/acylaminoacyl peptidase
MRIRLALAVIVLLLPAWVQAQGAPFNAAAAFGARTTASGLSLSPDGTHVAYIAPAPAQGSVLFTAGLDKDARPVAALKIGGKDGHLERCFWVADDRLVCSYGGVRKSTSFGTVPWERFLSVNTDGSNVKILSKELTDYSRYVQLGGDDIVDWLPDASGAVLMRRVYVPEDRGHIGSSDQGYGVDRLDTRTLEVKRVERPDIDAFTYITDGFGNVRIKGLRSAVSAAGKTFEHYYYRPLQSREWLPMGDPKSSKEEPFKPVAVDHDHNIAYGWKKKDGRWALYSVTLDEVRHEELVYARPDVDLSSLVRIGRHQRVVGVSYSTDRNYVEYFSPDIKQLLAVLHKAIPGVQLEIVDSSTDESKMLVFAGSDSDPGVYYLFDRKAHRLDTFLVARDFLEGIKLATMKPITYPSSDGALIPGYLTLPPGHDSAAGLPALVLPHGGPSARDEWGFDWLSQFFANRGYVVLQPNFRGSSGYGDAWFHDNGFHSWQVAIGDVLAAGHWLVKQGADPSRLAIFGWSYGGYAALQSAVVEPGTFKAVIAVAPVSDLAALKEQYRRYIDYEMISKFIGEGPHMHDGSPIEHVDKFKVPVLIFHGGSDVNVDIEQSRHMAERLKAAGVRCELVTWDELDHHLEDSAARTQMLGRSDAFLREAFAAAR